MRRQDVIDVPFRIHVGIDNDELAFPVQTHCSPNHHRALVSHSRDASRGKPLSLATPDSLATIMPFDGIRRLVRENNTHPLLHCPPDISPSKVEPGDLVLRGQELLLAGSAVLDTMDMKASSYDETADLIVTSPIS